MNLPGQKNNFLSAVSFSLLVHIAAAGFAFSLLAPVPPILMPEPGGGIVSVSLVQGLAGAGAQSLQSAIRPERPDNRDNVAEARVPERAAAPVLPGAEEQKIIGEHKIQLSTYASLEVYTNGHSAHSARTATMPGAGDTEGRPEGAGARQESATAPYLIPAYRLNNPPRYPVAARMRGQQGLVVVSAEVNPDGTVGNARVKHSSGHGPLDNSALDAVRNWVFKPGRRMGVPVAMWVDVPIRFALNE